MNDNEIIKALEHCVYKTYREEKCTECKYVTGCKTYLLRNSLNLINRQKAEIERLEKRLETVQGAKCVYSYDGETIEYCVHSPCPIYKTVDQIKADAIKEFAERLKAKRGLYGEIWESDIDKTVEEMTEETP